MDVHDIVIPSGYLAMEFVFAGIPVWGYVAQFLSAFRERNVLQKSSIATHALSSAESSNA
jgi:hypothetical protein